MFLQKVSRRLITHAVPFRCLKIVSGKTETEIIDRWKQKFANENVSEIETSIKHILHHVIVKTKVRKF